MPAPSPTPAALVDLLDAAVVALLPDALGPRAPLGPPRSDDGGRA